MTLWVLTFVHIWLGDIYKQTKKEKGKEKLIVFWDEYVNDEDDREINSD